jgi:hypothetical protein
MFCIIPYNEVDLLQAFFTESLSTMNHQKVASFVESGTESLEPEDESSVIENNCPSALPTSTATSDTHEQFTHRCQKILYICTQKS